MRGAGPAPAARRPAVGGRRRARRSRRVRAARRRAPLQRLAETGPHRPQRRGGARHAPTRPPTRSGRPSASTRSSSPAGCCSGAPRSTPAAGRSSLAARSPRLARVGRLRGLAAIAYAIGVRGYQGLGGTIGLSGHVRGPVGLRAGEPAGGRLPAARRHRRAGVRPAVGPAAPALAGHRAGAGGVGVRDGARADRVRDQAAAPARRDRPRVPRLEDARRGHAIAWDLLFYEPWFLALGLLVTAGALHHHRRTGGSATAASAAIAVTGAATLALTAVSCALLV